MKIIVIGPTGSGKTSLCNFLVGGKRGFSIQNQRPTIGARILEMETNVSKSEIVNIELWDISGNQSFEDCWPAIMDGCDGILLVFRAEADQEQEILTWHEYFVAKREFRPEACLALSMQLSNVQARSNAPKPGSLRQIKIVSLTVASSSDNDDSSSLENNQENNNNGDLIRREFEGLLTRIMS